MSDSKPKFKGYTEDKDHEPDPTAMTGTLDTSDTDGQLHTAADVTVGGFDGPDADSLAPEGALGGSIDPTATGKDALAPDYTDEQKRLAAQRQADANAGGNPVAGTTAAGVPAQTEGQADKTAAKTTTARKAAAKTTTAKTDSKK